MEEAHAYNVQQMSEYRARGNEEKYNDIQDLLRQMVDVMGKKKVLPQWVLQDKPASRNVT